MPSWVTPLIWEAKGLLAHLAPRIATTLFITLPAASGVPDLVAYFFLHCHSLLREGGLYGLLGVNTIAEGDTRAVGLEQLLGSRESTIVAAYPNEAWPGSANVFTSRVHLNRGPWEGAITLNGRPVSYVSAFLTDQEEWTPERLKANEGKSFQGSIILGLGFTLTEAEARGMIARDPKNAEVLFPYLNGKDLNSHPQQQASRWVINFFDWPAERAKQYTEPYSKVLRDVKPVRQELKADGSYKQRKPLPEKWWIYADKRPALYHSIGRGASFDSGQNNKVEKIAQETVICYAQTSKTMYPSRLVNDCVFDQKLVVFSDASPAFYAQLLSHVHYFWAVHHGSTQGTTPVYAPTDVFLPFPFLDGFSDSSVIDLVEAFHAKRAAACSERKIGLTKFYNLFHSKTEVCLDISEIRVLQEELDATVIDGYGWGDIELNYGFNSFASLPESDRIRFSFDDAARQQILNRLATLNKERHQEEVNLGLHAKKQSKVIVAPKKKSPAKRPRAQAAANDSAPLQQVAEPAAQYDMLGGVVEPALQQGNSWGTNAIDQILAWLEAHPGPQSQQAILNGSGASPEHWADAIAELIRDGDVIEEQGRYRAAS